MRFSPNTRPTLYVGSTSSQAMFDLMAQRLVGDDALGGGLPESGLRFHWAVQSGIAAYPGTDLTVIVGRPLNPASHSGTFWSSVTEHFSSRWRSHYVATVNLPLLKQLSSVLGVFVSTLRWRVGTRRCTFRTVIVDGAYVTALPAVLLALVGSKTTIIGLFADVYRYMGDVPDVNQRSGRITRILRSVMQACYAQLDGLVLLAETMNEVVNPADRPFIVMEGLTTDAHPQRERTPHAPRHVLYAGALRAEYGLPELVAGFRASNHEDWVLDIMGAGSYAEQLIKETQDDESIAFHGRVSPDDAQAAMGNADLLINPRPIDQPLSKFSFPSKLISYLASGTPVATTRLPSIPADYYPYLICIEKEGAEGVRDALERAFSLSDDERADLGARASDFVATEKNHLAQTARIMRFAHALRRS